MDNIRDTQGFCRGCLIKFDDPTDLLQYTEKNRRLYVYSTGLQVKRNEILTFQLCKDCYINMKLACKFKKQCRTSDKRFRNYLALKEEGDDTDFCTFLKNSDDAFMFRFPLMSGSSTPVNQRSKDDDNESTCTSIRNFMTDILPADEIPDTEARIIREVIAEEADILDDSLDSHWLQDDVSIATDFRLDCSFSPFSTPRSVNNEGCYTPQKLKESLQNPLKLNNYVLKEILKESSLIKNVPLKTEPAEEYVTPEECATPVEYSSPEENDTPEEYATPDYDPKNEKYPTVNENNETENENDSRIIENHGTVDDNNEAAYQVKFYVNNLEDNDDTEKRNDVQKIDTIDKNLEEALKDDGQEFALGDLLTTPRVFPGTSAMSTPTIANILFGDKLDTEDNEHKVGQCIEDYQNVKAEVDILEEFFNKGTEELDLDAKNPLEFDNLDDPADPWNVLEIKYNLKDFVCNVCNKKFKSAKAIKIHIALYHKEKIIGPKKVYPRTKGICNYCGNQFNDFRCLTRHIKLHMNPKQPCKCNYCGLEYSSKVILKHHLVTHTGKAFVKPKKKDAKKYVCSTCGFVASTGFNLTLHIRRHNKSYTHTCRECGKGFYTNSDLHAHERTHNGVKPHTCPYCDKKFVRRDTLTRHVKTHIDERRYKCNICNSEFIRENGLNKHRENSKKCLIKRLKAEVIQQASASKVTETIFYVIDGVETNAERIVSDLREDSNLCASENFNPIETDDTNRLATLNTEVILSDVEDDKCDLSSTENNNLITFDMDIL